MKRNARIVAGLLCFFVMVSFIIPAVGFGDKAVQARKLKVRQKSLSSIISTSKSAGKGAQKWTEIRLEFATKVKWVDELTVKYYALVKSAKSSEILYGDVTYINVPAGNKHISSLFVHPTTMAKYGGKIKSVHCELWAQGELRDVADFPSKPQKKWWEMKPSIKGVLFKRYFTPFALDAEYLGLAIKVEN